MNTLAGFAGAYGGLFSSTVIVVLLILEVARPGGRRFTKALAAEIVASSVSFGIYFAIAGAVFLDAYQVPSYTFEDWQLLAAIPLGLFAALVVTVLAGFMMGAARLFGRLKAPAIAKSTLGGVVFGIVGVALPLTMFSGSDQLKTVLSDAGALGLGLLAAVLIAKIATFAVSQASGFVGGPIFPSLFIGGTAGVLVHQVIPGVPLGLAFTCLLAAVPGALAARAVLHGADGRVPDPGRGAADRPHPDRRRHRLPHHGSRQVPARQPQAGPQSRGETSGSSVRVLGAGPRCVRGMALIHSGW